MSLRDQLLKAGLVTKKQARKSKQAQRKEARLQAGNLEKKRARDARRAEREAAEAAKRKAQRLAERKENQAIRDQYDRALRVRQLIRAHEMRAGGPLRYFHRALMGQIRAVQVSRGMLGFLKTGQVAVAVEHQGNDKVRYALIPASMAEKLESIQPGVVVHWTRGDRSEVVETKRDWEPDLRARRASPADIERLRAASRTT